MRISPLTPSQQTNKVISLRNSSRLNLTDEQAEQVEPILMAHMEKRMGVMQKHGISQGARSSGKQGSVNLCKDMDKINKQVERQLPAC